MNYTPAYIEQQLAIIQRVRDLHFKRPDGWCFECGSYYPCPTIRVLDGEEE